MEINKEEILKMYRTNETLRLESVVFKDWVSPDNKYLILLDELYDLENRKNMGNIWENFSNLTLFLSHIFEVSKNIPATLKESAKEFFGKLVITESLNSYERKINFQSMINEQGETWYQSLGGWLSNKGEEAVKGVKDFAKTSFDGAKKLIGNISQGEWTKVLDLVKKGTLYVARSLRRALYHPVGIVMDGILIATGIGKAVQWIPWAIVVALDIYELVSGNYEDPNEPMWMRLLFLGADILGLVFAGGVAKAAKSTINTLLRGTKTTKEAAKIVAKTPILKSIVQKIGKALGSAGSRLKQAASYLKTKFPKGAQFIESIIGKFAGFVERLSNSINQLLNKGATTVVPKLTSNQKLSVGGKETVKRTGLTYGIEKGAEIITGRRSPGELTPLASQSLSAYAKEGGFDDF
jgi:hypothetical protein